MQKKTNPNKIQRTQADVDRAYEKGLDFGRQTAMAIFMLTLLDKEGADLEIMQRVWREICDLSEDVINGTVTVPAIKTVLKEEYDINID